MCLEVRWLEGELESCKGNGSSVIVAAHHQAGYGGARATHLAWNWQDIKALLTKSQVVKLYLAGHDHMGGYISDGGVHWLTAEGLLEGKLCI